MKASDFSCCNSSHRDAAKVNCSNNSLTIMNPTFPHEDTTNCFQSRIWLLHSRVGPDKCETIKYKLSCGLSAAEVPVLIKAECWKHSNISLKCWFFFPPPKPFIWLKLSVQKKITCKFVLMSCPKWEWLPSQHA